MGQNKRRKSTTPKQGDNARLPKSSKVKQPAKPDPAAKKSLLEQVKAVQQPIPVAKPSGHTRPASERANRAVTNLPSGTSGKRGQILVHKAKKQRQATQSSSSDEEEEVDDSDALEEAFLGEIAEGQDRASEETGSDITEREQVEPDSKVKKELTVPSAKAQASSAVIDLTSETVSHLKLLKRMAGDTVKTLVGAKVFSLDSHFDSTVIANPTVDKEITRLADYFKVPKSTVALRMKTHFAGL